MTHTIGMTHLLEFLEFFSIWKNALDADVTLSKAQKAQMFVPLQLWTDIQVMVLGFVSMCTYYLRDGTKPPSSPAGLDSAAKGTLTSIESKRCSSDPCEWTFADVRQRQQGGYTTAAKAMATVGGVSTSRLFGAGGNSHMGPRDPGAAAAWGRSRPASAMVHKKKKGAK